MRKLVLNRIAPGIGAGLVATVPLMAWSQEVPLESPAPPVVPDTNGPQTGAPAPEDLARDKALAHDRLQAEARNQAAAKPKITGGAVAEAGGGVAGGLLAQGVGTAVAGPVGGLAAGWIGSTVGGKAVHAARKVFGKKKPLEPPQEEQVRAQAEATPPPAADAVATAPGREPEAPAPN